MKHVLELMDINCVLDVGANRGQFAHDLRDIGYRGYIVSFEPVISEFESLSESFAADPNWRGFPFALGEQSSTCLMNVVPKLTVLSSLLTLVQPYAVERRPVEIKRLDEMFSEAVKGIPVPRIGIPRVPTV